MPSFIWEPTARAALRGIPNHKPYRFWRPSPNIQNRVVEMLALHGKHLKVGRFTERVPLPSASTRPFHGEIQRHAKDIDHELNLVFIKHARVV
jgi:hypothetical protein